MFKRRHPLVDTVPEAREGSKLGDWGHLSFSVDDVLQVQEDSIAAKYLRPLVGAEEMINGIERWCLWLVDVTPEDVRHSPVLSKQLDLVRQARLASKKEPTKLMASYPGMFLEVRQPTHKYLLLPCVSSHRRRYIPMRFYDASSIASDAEYRD